ncbi:MAG: DUF748 domain-containing protein [bacterium]
MKKTPKILLTLFSIILIIIIAVTIALKLLITEERVKKILIPPIEKKINRRITIGSLSVGLFKGITISNLTVANNPLQSPQGEGKGRVTEENFVSFAEFVVKPNLFALLKKQLIITKLNLIKPNIYIEKNKLRKLNFDDILKNIEGEKTRKQEDKKAGRQEDESGIKDEKDGMDKGQGFPFELLVEKVIIKDGALYFSDKTHSPAFDIRLANIDLAVKDINLVKPIPFSLQANIIGKESSLLKISGDLSLSPQGLTALTTQVSVQNFDIAYLAPYYKRLLPFTLNKALLDFDLNAKVVNKLQEITAVGTVNFKDTSFLYNKFSASAIEGLSLGSGFDLVVNLANEELHINSLTPYLKKIKMILQGVVKKFKSSPAWSLDLAINTLPLSDVLDSIPKQIIPILTDISLQGLLNLKADLKGEIRDIRNYHLASTLDLTEGSFRYNMMPNLNPSFNLHLRLDERDLKVKDSDLTLNQNLVTIAGAVNNYLLNNRVVELNLTSNEFNVNKAMEVLKTSSKIQEESTKEIPKKDKKKDTEEVKPVDLKGMKISSSLKIANLLYNKLTVRNFNIKANVVNNIATIRSINSPLAQIGQGEVDVQKLVIDLNNAGLDYNASLSVNKVEANDFVSSFTPGFANTIYGTLSAKTALRGHGTLPENIKKNLNANGDFKITDGKVTNSKLLANISSFINIERLRNPIIKEVNGKFKIENGWIYIPDLSLLSSDISLFSSGKVGLDKELDLTVDLALDKSLAENLKIGSFIDKTEDIHIPIFIGGDLSSPKISLNQKALQEKAMKQFEKKGKELLKEKVDESLKKLFKGNDQGNKQKGGSYLPSLLQLH